MSVGEQQPATRWPEYQGIFIAVGSGVGMAVGLVLAGGTGIALGAALGAAAGVIVDAAFQATRRG